MLNFDIKKKQFTETLDLSNELLVVYPNILRRGGGKLMV